MLFQATKMSLKIDTSALGHPHKPKCAFNPLSRFKPLSKVAFVASAFAALLSSSAFSAEPNAVLSTKSNAETNSKHEIRLVSAGTGVTELVLALDAGNELIAIDSTSYVPEGLAHVAKLGYHRMLSAEGIIALSPTLVVGSDVMGPETTLNVLKQANIQVVQLPATNDEPQLMSNVDTLGQLLNRPDNAIKLKQDLHQQLQSLADKKHQISDAGAQPKILFMLLQEGRGARVGGKGTAADTIIALSGAQNIAEFDGYKSMSQEGILSLQPDIILLSKRSDKPAEQTNAQIAQELIKEMPLIAHTPAGKNGNIQTLPPQALLGGLGISAISAADTLASTLLKQNQ
ncbi:Hemin-binding periplasmic protein hmuT precursor [Shewanella baltica]|uniref:hemin ABC transporter substrate-binding protein n=1 Tax=Shewanella baltica TaxID=62322 RepID=UPI000F715AD4|nr:hemin ABC transporter substrate-binding protein [Shewanella baltica]VEF24923.1 Hemin-binding periplasmic protein hmuT precursor [Shewanella baltica]